MRSRRDLPPSIAAVAASRLGRAMVPGLSPRRAVPQSGGRLCRLPSAAGHGRAGRGPGRAPRRRPVASDSPRHRRTRTARRAALRPRHARGRPHRRDRPFRRRCCDRRRAAAAGASLSTHLGNGLPQLLPKLDNTLFAQLGEDRLAASFIADGIHLPPQALKRCIRAKGFERSLLVTDAVAAAAAPPGRYPRSRTWRSSTRPTVPCACRAAVRSPAPRSRWTGPCAISSPGASRRPRGGLAPWRPTTRAALLAPALRRIRGPIEAGAVDLVAGASHVRVRVGVGGHRALAMTAERASVVT